MAGPAAPRRSTTLLLNAELVDTSAEQVEIARLQDELERMKHDKGEAVVHAQVVQGEEEEEEEAEAKVYGRRTALVGGILVLAATATLLGIFLRGGSGDDSDSPPDVSWNVAVCGR